MHGRHRLVFAKLKPRDDGRRWMCKGVNNAIKRVSGSTRRSRKQNTLFAEAGFELVACAVGVQGAADESGVLD